MTRIDVSQVKGSEQVRATHLFTGNRVSVELYTHPDPMVRGTKARFAKPSSTRPAWWMTVTAVVRTSDARIRWSTSAAGSRRVDHVMVKDEQGKEWQVDAASTTKVIRAL